MHSQKAGSLCSSDVLNYCKGVASVMAAIPAVGLTGVPAVIAGLMVVIALHCILRS